MRQNHKQPAKSPRIQKNVDVRDRFRALFETMPVGVVFQDSEGHITAANSAAQEILGLTLDQMQGRTSIDPRWKAVHEDGSDFLGETHPAMLSLKSGQPVHNVVMGVLNPYLSSYRWININAIPRFAPGADTPFEVYTTFEDITERKQAEATLKMFDERFRRTFDDMLEGCLVIGFDWRYLYLNEAAASHEHQKREAMLGCSLLEIYPGMEQSEIFAHYRKCMEDRVPQHFTSTFAFADGIKKFYEMRVQPTAEGIFVLRSDITQRVLAEEALRDSQVRFSKVFYNSPNGINIFRLSDGRSIDVNDSYLEIVGYSREEVMGHTAAELDLFVNTETRDGWMQQLLAKNQLRNQDAKIRRKSGEIRDILVSFDLFEINGEPVVMAIATDITERKRVEAALLESEEKFRLVTETIEDVFWMSTPGVSKMLYVSPAYEKLWQLSREELYASPRSFLSIIHPDDLQQYLSVMSEYHAKGLAYECEYRIQPADGTTHWIRERGFPIRDATGNFFMMTGNCTDITKRKKAEKALLESEARFRRALEAAGAVPYFLDFKTDTYSFIGNGILGLTGYTAHEMTPAFFGSLQSEEHFLGGEASLTIQEASRLMRTGQLHRWRSDSYVTTRLGDKVWITDTSVPIFAETGEVVGAMGFLQDLTERKRAEEQIQTQLKRLHALSEIDRVISSSMDMSFSLKILIDHVLLQLGVDAASILILNTFNQTLDFAAGKGFRGIEIQRSSQRLGDGLGGKVGLERKIIYVSNLAEARFTRAELLKNEGFVEYIGVPLIAKGQLKGVLEIFQRSHLKPSMEWMNFLETLAGQGAIAIDNVQMFEEMQRSNKELITAYDATIEGWSRAMDLRDKETEGHALRVTDLTLKLAERMGISEQEKAHLRRGALLHDIGKLGVPDDILFKSGQLTEEELDIMRRHTISAYELLSPIPYLRQALDVPYCHHEKWDGTGYPRGLKGKTIPLVARLFAVADVWDALRSDRPYRKRWPAKEARAYILEQSGKQFDPLVVDAFIQLLAENSEMWS